MQKIILALLSLLLVSCAETKKPHAPLVNIAIVMPLTGEYSEIGQRAASLIELGLEDGLEGNIKVMTYDIADPEKMTAAANKIRSRGTNLVLGPIFANQAKDLLNVIKSDKVALMTLSNNPALAGGNVYVFGHMPIKQTERILNYMLDNHYKQFITLLPPSKYSSDIAEIAGGLISSRGGKLIHTELYTDKDESIEAAAQNIAKIVDGINELEENSTKPVIYISDEAGPLKKLVAALKKRNLDISAVIIGDNRINLDYEDDISYLYTGSVKYDARDLVKKMDDKQQQVKHLNYMDLVAYDLGRIASHTIGQGLPQDQFLARLNSGHLFEGASGYVKFTSNIAERKYDIIQHDAGGDAVVNSAR